MLGELQGQRSLGSQRVGHAWVPNMHRESLYRAGGESVLTPSLYSTHIKSCRTCTHEFTQGNQYSLKYMKKVRGKTKAPQRAWLTCEKGNLSHPRAKSSHEFSLPHEESLLSVGITTVKHLKYSKWYGDFCLNPKGICLHKKCFFSQQIMHRIFFLTKHTFSPPKCPKLSSCGSQNY